MCDPHLLSPEKQSLLSNIAAQAVFMNMPCYLIGGFARDLLLGKPVNDLDVIVEGNAIQFGDELVGRYGGKLTAHPKFYTAIWHLPDSSGAIDLITARSETYPHAGALPTVFPSAIEDDISRRDFTINTMAVRLDGERFGELIDLLEGQDDLAHGIIRVLHPSSFLDDPTRIFRAIRYEQRYNFSIDEETLSYINGASLKVLSALSGERIRHEFDLIFKEEKSARMMSRLKDLGVLDVLNLPKFNQEYADLLNAKLPVEFDLPEDRALLGYLLWLMDTPKGAIHTLSKRFDFTLEISANAVAASKLKNDLPEFKGAFPSVWTFYLEKFPPFAVYALWLATGESALKEYLGKWRTVKQITTGDDLKSKGIPAGPRYKEILTKLRAAWLDGEVKSMDEEKELLIALL